MTIYLITIVICDKELLVIRNPLYYIAIAFLKDK